jgi:hypothetical protein
LLNQSATFIFIASKGNASFIGLAPHILVLITSTNQSQFSYLSTVRAAGTPLSNSNQNHL